MARKKKVLGKDLTTLHLYPWPYAWEPRRPEGFTQPPKAHTRRPTPLSIHPLAWVNQALAHGRKIHKWLEPVESIPEATR